MVEEEDEIPWQSADLLGHKDNVFVVFYTYVPMMANFEIDNGTKTAESTKYHSLIEFAQALKMLVSED